MSRRQTGRSRRHQVQRVGAPAWSPLDDPDTIVWLDAALSPRTESGGVIDQWNNLVTGGAHATATLTGRPAYNATALGGAYPGIVFTGVNNMALVLSALTGATGITVLLVASDAITAARYILEHSANGGVTTVGTFALIANITNAGSLSFYARGDVGSNVWRSAASSETLATHKVIACRANFAVAGASEVSPIRSNGVALSGAQVGTAENTAAFTSQTLAIGAQGGGSNPWNGTLGSLIIVKRTLSDADLLVFERYLGDRFGLPFEDAMATRQSVRIMNMGQSNDLGQPDVSTAEIDRWDGPHESPRVWSYKNTEILASGIITDDWGGLRANQPSDSDWQGPDLVWCMELVRNYNLAPEQIMCARGATSLAASWPKSAGNMFTRAKNALTAALGSHPDEPDSLVTWVVWIQGEQDAASETNANNYAANLTQFMADVRADFPSLSAAKWVIVKLHPDCSLGTEATNATIRAAQEAVAAADVIGAYTVEVSDLALQADSLHWAEATQIEMGKRIAAVIGANT